mgnify:CR=1 FL=1
MKCTVRYEIDGEKDFFVITERDGDRCETLVYSELEKRGLDGEKNNVLIDVEFDKKRSAHFFMIPCWYYTDTGNIEGRNLFFDCLLIFAEIFTSLLSLIFRFFTGRELVFNVKYKAIE